MAERKLYRSRTNRHIAGVCGGLAEYLNLDPLLVRVLVVVFALANGAGLLFYILAWLFVPEAPLRDGTTEVA
jgi:phage shock protein PspC (stress-responsive transcriptional regulator)